MKKTLTFTVSIKAPKRSVWETMLDDQGYRIWTSAFCFGQYMLEAFPRALNLLKELCEGTRWLHAANASNFVTAECGTNLKCSSAKEKVGHELPTSRPRIVSPCYICLANPSMLPCSE